MQKYSYLSDAHSLTNICGAPIRHLNVDQEKILGYPRLPLRHHQHLFPCAHFPSTLNKQQQSAHMVFSLEWPGRNQSTTEVMYALCVCMHTRLCCRKGKRIRCKGPKAQQTLMLFKESGGRPGPMSGMTLRKVTPGERDRVGLRWVGRTESKLLWQHAFGSLFLPPCAMPVGTAK